MMPEGYSPFAHHGILSKTAPLETDPVRSIRMRLVKQLELISQCSYLFVGGWGYTSSLRQLSCLS